MELTFETIDYLTSEICFINNLCMTLAPLQDGRDQPIADGPGPGDWPVRPLPA